jgi:antirestriction protein ArdC
MTNKQKIEWAKLLEEAVTVPGIVSTCYSKFHDYSLFNQLYALQQCHIRGLQPGPINTFKGWLRLERHVKQGEKALWLWMPRTGKATEKDPMTGEERERAWTYFVVKPFWFTLSQTDGEPYMPEALPEWDPANALDGLNIKLVDFASTDGNSQGYARQREVAVNPLGGHQTRTLVHEMAHILLGHTADDKCMTDGKRLSRKQVEMEAEATALLVCDALDLPGAAEARAYIQSWYGLHKEACIEDASAKRIIMTADKILRAGHPAKVKQEVAA